MGWGARILYITMRALLYTYIQYISWEIAVSPGGAESGRVPKSPHTVILCPESQEAQPTEWDEEIKKNIYIYTQKFYKRRPLIFFSFYVPMFNVTDDWFLLSESKRSTANENDNSRWKRKKMVFFFLFFGAIQTLAGKSGGRKRKKELCWRARLKGTTTKQDCNQTGLNYGASSNNLCRRSDSFWRGRALKRNQEKTEEITRERRGRITISFIIMSVASPSSH